MNRREGIGRRGRTGERKNPGAQVQKSTAHAKGKGMGERRPLLRREQFFGGKQGNFAGNRMNSPATGSRGRANREMRCTVAGQRTGMRIKPGKQDGLYDLDPAGRYRRLQGPQY